jgi:DNA-binding SARP family transcriptional activator
VTVKAWTIKVSGGQSIVSLPDSWDVDASAFQQRAADASKAYESGGFADARSSALAALALWYDNPLPDAGQRAFVIPFVEHLRGIHWATTVTRIKAEICLGRPREMVAELRQLARRHPDEGIITVLLATALYRSELVPEAAMACQRAIASWDGKGVDARRLQALQHAILNEAAPIAGPLGW